MARATDGSGTEQVAHAVVYYGMNTPVSSYMRLHWVALIGWLAVALVAWSGPSDRVSAEVDFAQSFAQSSPRVGEKAADFTLRSTTGDSICLSDLYREKPVVVEFGSLSCPIFRGKIAAMEQLYREFGDEVHFLVVYTVEAHPADSPGPYRDSIWVTDRNRQAGILINQPSSFDERWAVALETELLQGINRTVVVDRMDNETWQQYGQRPNCAIVIDTGGRVALKQMWCNPGQLRRHLGQHDQATATSADHESVQVIRDIEYGVGDGSRHLDAYLPREPTPHPAVVCIHGGGWRGGDKGGYRRTAMWYATHGVAAFAINYRLSGVAPYPAAVDDCLAAIRFLRGHADEYNIDIYRMGVEGGSAGGHLVLMVALMEPGSDELDSAGQPLDNWVRCVYAKNGPTDLTQAKMNSESALVQFMGGTYAQMPEAYRAASPISYVSADDPPVLMIHGTEDRTVPYSQSVALKESLEEAGVAVELITIEGAGHGLRGGNPEELHAARERAHQFMLEHLLLEVAEE